MAPSWHRHTTAAAYVTLSYSESWSVATAECCCTRRRSVRPHTTAVVVYTSAAAAGLHVRHQSTMESSWRRRAPCTTAVVITLSSWRLVATRSWRARRALRRCHLSDRQRHDSVAHSALSQSSLGPMVRWRLSTRQAVCPSARACSSKGWSSGCTSRRDCLENQTSDVPRPLGQKRESFWTRKVDSERPNPRRLWQSVCQGQPLTFGSHCFRSHPNRFTFGGVIAEHVKTVFAP